MKNNKWASNTIYTISKRIREHKEMHEKQHQLHMEYQKKIHDINGFYRHSNEFQRYRNHIKYTRPFIVVFNLIIWFLIFRFLGIKTLSIIFALLVSIGGLVEFFFLANLEKRIFKPINQLKVGVEEVAKGNYDIKVDCEIENEIGVLVKSFNEMVNRLKEGEVLKQQYEENRKSLIANISHDLKTPITSIQGYIETMADRNDIPVETVNKYHQIIYNNAAYMNKLIDDLFLFSKLDMQKLEFDFQNISIKDFMADLMEEFNFELEDRSIAFEYEDKLSRKLDFNIDLKRIHQVFRNIIGNAIKYGDEKNLKINVKLYEKNNFIQIDIVDNGSGIPADKLPYIFDRFYRIDYARTKNLMSTGLGLAISKELVEAHGGKIKVRSREGEGTCFTIVIPAKEHLKGE
ncbi:sensor histidine kinase [Clostridium folliculivorans]|uniref:histidine kinase n=1 Tax=Clostridium folliculivorans TaxID=2886038 RepID=A0A9W5Y128_9CLOT|nr:HAMP domain-containing sensor histidine kinase [Clostridium folliculivorans]GKU24641.1 two-component sensor histidine kinase [Clostridium folliculivorans]GKU30739.1 two-component sensor histidine kinase [Clostridium folliculivorans]